MEEVDALETGGLTYPLESVAQDLPAAADAAVEAGEVVQNL